MTDKHSNIQVYFLLVESPRQSFVVGTPTQRGFTQVGVSTALKQVEDRIPKGWKVRVITVNPISSLF